MSLSVDLLMLKISINWVILFLKGKGTILAKLYMCICLVDGGFDMPLSIYDSMGAN